MATPLLTRRLRPVDLYAIDALSALAAALVCLTAAFASPQEGGPNEPVWLSVVTASAIGLPIAVRRRWPVAVAIFVSVATAIALFTSIIPNFAALAPACAVGLASYTLGATHRTWNGLGLALGCSAIISLGIAWPTFLDYHRAHSADAPEAALALLFGPFVMTPLWAFGYTIGERRHQNAERNEQLVRQAAVEERLRVARELHDIVAHTMTLIVVKAAIGNHVAEASPAEARDALRVIETTGRSAMLEVRRVLDMLREDTPLAPMPGLADLSTLAEQATVGGVEVLLEVEHESPQREDGTVPSDAAEADGGAVMAPGTAATCNAAAAAARATGDVEQRTNGATNGGVEERTSGATDSGVGERTSGATDSGVGERTSGATNGGVGVQAVGVSESVGLSVYRIVQEAVTNVVKHAAPAKCRVRVVVGSEEVRVEVTDDGSRAARIGGVGHGLIGMRERVAMHGGTFNAGPREGGGFAVSATLPVGVRR